MKEQVQYIVMMITIVVLPFALFILLFCAIRWCVRTQRGKNTKLAPGRARRVKPKPKKAKKKSAGGRPTPPKPGPTDEQARPSIEGGYPETAPQHFPQHEGYYCENFVYEGFPDYNRFSAPNTYPPFGHGDMFPMEFVRHEARTNRYSKNVERYKK